MATVNFLYRSKRDTAFLVARFLFRDNDKPSKIKDRQTKEYKEVPYTDYVLSSNTKIEILKDHWNKIRKLKRINEPDILDTEYKFKIESKPLNDYIIKRFNNAEISEVNKVWFKKVVDEYYNIIELIEDNEIDIRGKSFIDAESKYFNPTSESLTENLIGYFDVFIDNQKGEIKESSIKKYRVIQSKLKRFEKHFKTTLKVKDINENFKKQFRKFCDLNQYSQNTRQRELVLIKTVCFNAKHNGIEASHQLNKDLKFKRETVKHPYLSLIELETIKNKVFDKEHLNNARDWLIVSCFTGQRVSDFMKFTKDNIRIEDGKKYIDFKQLKGSKLTTIPVLKQVEEILNKRKGEFPRPISDQKYNDYIKEVCKQCGINEVMNGKKRISIAPEGVKPKKHHYRDVITTAPKHEFISSHIGRRSFATNHYGKVPTTYLIGITNHSTEAQFLNYIQKAESDLAKDAHQYFN
jgi:hypothetical protein